MHFIAFTISTMKERESKKQQSNADVVVVNLEVESRIAKSGRGYNPREKGESKRHGNRQHAPGSKCEESPNERS